ncbi:hypothetical protein [Rhizobium sp. NXC24]|uniref:hypothetical protein n=1 Tax=Rhizobium sp. NXC24 TaxID=2048897 RepID=UPI000CDF3BA0|nr:hypothetical protein [Rhizobium sp. NXC24]AVA21958.1 hypothetical protein NXC24_CH02321 [Rhizobium sp. NXC24]
MSEPFPLHPDRAWYDFMVARYGDAVPPFEHLQFRRGLHTIVGDLFHDLDIADRFHAYSVHGINTLAPGVVVIDARFSSAATRADKHMCNRILERIQERLCEACEHCGREASVLVDKGDDPIRLLCRECYESWRDDD